MIQSQHTNTEFVIASSATVVASQLGKYSTRFSWFPVRFHAADAGTAVYAIGQDQAPGVEV